METIFYRIFLFLRKRKTFFFVGSFLVFSLMILLLWPLKLEEDISKLLPKTKETEELNKILKEADFSDKIIVHISRLNEMNEEALLAYAREISDSIQLNCKPYISEFLGEFKEDDISETRDFMLDHLPLFLEDADYQKIESRIHPDSIDQILSNHFRILMSPGGIVAKDLIRKDPFGISINTFSKLEDLNFENDLTLDSGFLTSRNRNSLLLFISPLLPTNETEKNTDFVNLLKRISKNLNQKYQGEARSEFYGSTIIAVSNAGQIKADIKYTITWAMLILLGILILFYRKFWIPLVLFLPSLFGAATSIILLQLFRPTVSAISLGIGSVLLGITLDYSLHILTHYRKNADPLSLYRDVTRPILMSGITTAVAFMCLTLLNSQALQDLGFFAAISVASASVYALIVIPLTCENSLTESGSHKTLIDRFAAYPFDRSKFLLSGVVILLMLGLYGYDKVLFNKDLNSMNYQSEEVLKAGEGLESILNLSSKSVYVVSYGEEPDRVLDLNNEVYNSLLGLREGGLIKSFSSNGGIVLSGSNQNLKNEKWQNFWTDSLKNSLKLTLIDKGDKYGFKANTYEPFFSLIDEDPEVLNLADYKRIKALMTDEFIQGKDDFILSVNLVKLNEEGKKALSEVISKTDQTLMIDRKELSEAFLGGLKNDFSSLVNYSIIAVFIILLLFFRNLELTFLTAFPILLTWLITLGVMGVFGIEFTIFNVIISTFIFGLGVDYSIFVSTALIKDYTYGHSNLKVYRTSIILSVITTIFGVGVLILAKHPALRSIAEVSLIGINITWLVVFITQPLLFRILVKNRVRKGFAPIRLRQLFFAIVLTVYYSLAGMILSVLSLLLMPLIPVSKKKKFKFLHQMSALLVRTVLYLNPFVSKKVINPHGETFEKPAIIISNHASALDTLTFGLLAHNLIYLVNDWVYKSPVFGLLARVMGFYPVSSGVEASSDHLKEKVRQGYSLVIFPEGKRSFSNKVGRFHKGAFYLQQLLKIDILPIYLHGNAEVMPKNDFIIHDGKITVVVGERISFEDKRFGTDYRERNKAISAFYKSNFEKKRMELEPADYFKDVLFSNFFAKTSGLLKEVKSDFNKNKEKYKQLNDLLPYRAKVLHLAHDLGQVDILLISKSLNRKITSIYRNENKRKVAQNCYTLIHRGVEVRDRVPKELIDRFDLLLISEGQEKKVVESCVSENIKRLICSKDFEYLDLCLAQDYEIKGETSHYLLLERKSF